MIRGQNNERIELPCKFGTLVCEIVRDDEHFKELAIDLYRSDDKAVQVCVVGTCEYEPGNSMNQADAKRHCEMIHVVYWDGESEDCCGTNYVEPFGDGWYEETGD